MRVAGDAVTADLASILIVATGCGGVLAAWLHTRWLRRRDAANGGPMAAWLRGEIPSRPVPRSEWWRYHRARRWWTLYGPDVELTALLLFVLAVGACIGGAVVWWWR